MYSLLTCLPACVLEHAGSRERGAWSLVFGVSCLCSAFRDIPGGQLGPHIICGADETGFGQGATEEGQLAKTYWTDLAFDPSVKQAGLAFGHTIRALLRVILI